MPFVPLTPEEKRIWEPCKSPQHNPPNMMVIRKPMAWVCPSCGLRTVIYPQIYYLDNSHESYDERKFDEYKDNYKKLSHMYLLSMVNRNQ